MNAQKTDHIEWTLVTGGAKRLGASICRQLALHGYPVVIHYYKSEKEACELVSECLSLGVEAACIQGDLSTSHSTQLFIERYRSQFPQTKHLINNVGNYLIQSALQTSVEEWLELFQTNLHAPFILIKNLISSIRLSKGCIINLGFSGIERMKANTYCTAYHLTKIGLWMLTRSLAAELAPEGIRVNMVSPGQLDISVDLPKDLSRLPMHRPAFCEEVSRVILFLLDPKNEYLTGQNIEVAGGVGL